MKTRIVILLFISLTAYMLEAVNVFNNFFNFGPAHKKISGLNDLNTLLSNDPLLFDLGQYFFVGLLAYISLSISSALLSAEAERLGLPQKFTTLVAVLILGGLLRLIQLSNAVEFPHSYHNVPTNLPSSLTLTALCLLFLLGPAIWAARQCVKHLKKFAYIGVTLAGLYGISVIPIHMENDNQVKPNIIILSVDSLRPDHVGDEPLTSFASTPFLDQQLQQATWYKNAYTPMARTYPAWASLLTGQYPTEHGVRFSLTGNNHAIPDRSIAKQLQHAGYHTLYAMDERRFSYIDEQWGFDQIFGPKAGAADFALGSVHDISLINLLSLLPFANSLLPITNNNRAIETLYSPEKFARDLANDIQNLPKNKPAFIATHLCLPHWPFGWKDKDAFHTSQQPELRHRFYSDALTESDRQLSIIWKGLEQAGLLDNAIVLFVSDHGEGHALPQDLIDESLNALVDDDAYQGLLNSFGHGTSLLSLTQNRILLAIKDMRANPSLNTGNSQAPTSLLDVAATIADAAGIKRVSPHGQSLLNRQAIESRADDWYLFLESGFTVAAMRGANTNVAAVADQSMEFYKLTEQGRLSVREDLWDSMLSKKQLGVLTNDGSMLINVLDRKSDIRRWHLYDAHEQQLNLDVSEKSAKVKQLKSMLAGHFGSNGHDTNDAENQRQ